MNASREKNKIRPALVKKDPIGKYFLISSNVSLTGITLAVFEALGVEIRQPMAYDRLRERVNGMSDPFALVVIHMQRGFLEEGYPLFCGETARRTIRPVRDLIEEQLRQGTPLFFTVDAHVPDDEEFKIYPPHCIRGTVEAQIIPELSSYLEKGTLLETRRYSVFFETDLDRHLQRLNVRRLIVCGVCTDICVMHTVADARFRDYQVEVPRDCVASFDEEAHRFGLRHMESVLGAKIT